MYARFTPFQSAKLLTAIGSGLYLVILGYYTLWLAYLHVQTCFRGKVVGGKKEIWLQSKFELPNGEYRLTVLDPVTGKSTDVTEKWNVGQWIYEDGMICGDLFCSSMKDFISSNSFKSFLKSD